MKKILIFICAGLILSACTKDQNPFSKIEDVLSDNKSLTEIERGLKEEGKETETDDVNKDLTAEQLSSQPSVSPSPQLQKTIEAKQINLSNEEIINMSERVTIKTSRGDIVLKLFPEVAPQTVENFLTKAKSDYYKGLIFHRVEDWVIQGGDPLGNGTGGGKMPTELSNTPFLEGSLGVARGGDIRISNDSQFFICTKDSEFLTGQYTNFGEVIEGMDVVKSTQIGDTIVAIEPSNETTK